jgi:serine/threonine-protein kinase
VTTQPPTLSTATPAGPIAVPDLVGQRFAGARARLESLGFAATKTDVTSDQPAGTVVGQSPAAGSKLARGSQVALSVAASTTTTTPAATTTAATTTTATTAPTTTAAVPPPPQNATMPDVSGQAEAAAVQAMGNAGLLASLAFVPSKDPLGTVEQQAKPAGTTVPYHAHVQINISKGPNSTTSAQVPSVVGQTLTEALSALNGAHLRLIYLKFPVSSRAQAGKIVQQSPLGGGEAPQNAQVLVFLGAYRAP